MTYEVVSDVPLPVRGDGQRSKYPFAAMEIGDSVLISDGNDASARSQASRYGKLSGRKFTGRTEPTGVRVWRTA